MWHFSVRRVDLIYSLNIGDLINDDGDGNDNGKKAIGLELLNNNFARVAHFFVHFFPVTGLIRRKTA